MSEQPTSEHPMTDEPADGEQSPMNFWDHLMELRARLMRVLIGVGLGFIVAAIFSKYIIDFLCVPMEDFRAARAANPDLPDVPQVFRAMEPTAGFSAWLSVALFGGLVLAMPYILYQVWCFVRPGLKHTERGAVVPLVGGGTALFLAGASVAYFYAAPAALKFLFAMNRMFGIEETSGLPEYIKMILMLMIGFGIGFQLPLVMFILSSLGITGPAFYRSRRKYAVVLAFVFGAFLTPPDAPSQIIMAGCLLVLFEFGILLSSLAQRRRARREADEEEKYAAEDAAEAAAKAAKEADESPAAKPLPDPYTEEDTAKPEPPSHDDPGPEE